MEHDHQLIPAWITTIIAVLAFLQYWAIAAWRRFLRRGRVEIHPVGKLEIGYGAFGPQLNLAGTVFGFHTDMFVLKLSAKVTRDSDSSTHEFAWLFRKMVWLVSSSTGTQRTEGEQIRAELPSGFVLSATEPRPYNLILNDTATLDRLRPAIQKYQSEWFSFLQAHGYNDGDTGSLFQEFSKKAHDLYRELHNAFYWHKDTYRLEVSVHTLRPRTTYRARWRFHLTEEQSTLLALNVLHIMSQACGQTSTPFFAYPDYEELGQ